MPSDFAATKVVGLSEFRREIKKLDEAGLIDELKNVNFDVAQLVVRAAQNEASSRMEQSAAQSLKPSRQAARAQVTGGGAKFPFFGGAEFGADRNQPRGTLGGRRMTGWNQFKPWRGNGSGAGYFLYPAIRSKTDEIVDKYGDALMKIAAHAFPD